jgi:hypothetical protein
MQEQVFYSICLAMKETDRDDARLRDPDPVRAFDLDLILHFVGNLGEDWGAGAYRACIRQTLKQSRRVGTEQAADAGSGYPKPLSAESSAATLRNVSTFSGRTNPCNSLVTPSHPPSPSFHRGRILGSASLSRRTWGREARHSRDNLEVLATRTREPDHGVCLWHWLFHPDNKRMF